MKTVAKRIFHEAFRVFFLSAGVFALLSGLVWLVWLSIHYLGGMVSEMPFSMAPHQWHAHEMIFGYGSAALGGFLLTAVPNWTSTKSASGHFVAISAGIWCAGRLAVWWSGMLPVGLVAAVDLAFLPILWLQIAVQLRKRPKPQNVVFLLFLTFFWVGNLLVHLDWMGVSPLTLDQGLRMGLLSLLGMIGVLGGRVTPGFTRNAMNREGVDAARLPHSRPVLDKASLVLSIALPLVVFLPEVVAGMVAIALGAVQLVRLAQWHGIWCLTRPILLALHLGMGLLGVGLVLWGAAILGQGSEVAAMHFLGIGAVGGMTLAVMSRAVLGHTGHDLIAPQPIAVAYVLMSVTALLRWLGSTLSGDWYFPLVLISGAMWIAVFFLYLIALGPIFAAPRLPRAA